MDENKQEHNDEVAAATKRLLRVCTHTYIFLEGSHFVQEIIPTVAEKLDTALLQNKSFLRDTNLVEFIHRDGVNARHIGTL